jgi:hypothetical protein
MQNPVFEFKVCIEFGGIEFYEISAEYPAFQSGDEC